MRRQPQTFIHENESRGGQYIGHDLLRPAGCACTLIHDSFVMREWEKVNYLKFESVCDQIRIYPNLRTNANLTLSLVPINLIS